MSATGKQYVNRTAALAADECTGPNQRLTVSVKSLAAMLDAHRSSVRRWLQEAGIRPVILGRGRNSAIRYHWVDVEAWLTSRPHVD